MADDKKELSIEEMLAAARGEKGGSDAAPAEKPAESAEEPAAAEKPAGEMSVEEMLAAARGGASDSKSAKSKPAGKPDAAKKPAAKEAAEPAEAAVTSSGSRDSGSLLGARKEKPPGPMTNEQARDAGKATPQLKPEKGAKE
ncbi:MAG: hypothetical protein VB817_13540, partial [Pirellulaceae bacterium]